MPKEKSKFGSGLGNFRKSTYSYRLTDDQKKYRAMSLLKKQREGYFSSEILTLIGTTQRRGTVPFLDELEEDGLIKKTPVPKSNFVKYQLTEKGHSFLDTLKKIKSSDPENPILGLDVFNMAKNEESIEGKKEIFDKNFSL